MFSSNLAKNVLMETSKEIERGRERERGGEKQVALNRRRQSMYA